MKYQMDEWLLLSFTKGIIFKISLYMFPEDFLQVHFNNNPLK